MPAGSAPTITRQAARTELGAWERVECDPRPALADAVSTCYGFRQRMTAPAVHRTVPFAGLPLVVTFGPEHEILADDATTTRRRVGSFVAGVPECHGFLAFDTFHGMQANLTPLGAFRLLGPPVGELSGRIVELETLLGAAGRRLVERLAAARAWPERFRLLEDFLVERIAAGPAPAPEVVGAWRLLAGSDGTAPIARIAEQVGWTRQHLTRRFRAQAGLTPKRMARLLRFDRAVERLRHADGPDLAAVAHAAGYYDQAHFSNEIRDFCGLTPTELIARPTHGGGLVRPC